MKLVVTGGGTGGHIFAGIAIAQEFLSQSKGNDALFVGSESGLETRLVPKAGLKIETVSLGKLMGQSIFARIVTLIQIPIAVLKCIFILKKFKADMVVGVGGYAAGPCIVAARILGIATGVLEQNSVMGLTNRLCAKLSHHVFLAFEEIPKGIPPSKCVITGNPARSNLKPTPVKSSKPFVIFTFGGSQGAQGINKMMLEMAADLSSNKDEIKIYHQTGERDYEWVVKGYAEIGYPVEVFKFIDDMQSMYNKASIVICRAGSGTITELAATQNAAIFIPFPQAASNHQEVNARIVEKTGAAQVLLQTKSNGRELANMIRHLMNDPGKIESMRANMAQLHKPDAAKRIVDLMKTRVLCTNA